MSLAGVIDAGNEQARLQATLDLQREQLESAAQNVKARRQLRSSLRTQDGTETLLAQLGEHIAKDSFLIQLQQDAEHAPPPLPGGAHHEVLSSDWWSVTDAGRPEEVGLLPPTSRPVTEMASLCEPAHDETSVAMGQLHS